MNFIWDKITEWLKGLLVSGIISNLSGLFDAINTRVGEAAAVVGTTPQAWHGGIFQMIRSLSENVVVPIAGIILTFIMCLELIQMLIDRNSLHDFDTFLFFKWIFKTFAAVLIVTNTWNIVMAVFDVAQNVVSQASGIIIGDTALNAAALLGDMEQALMAMEIGPLFGLWFQSSLMGILAWVLSICIFIVIYGRMIEIYMVTSIAPIPMATMVNREWGQMGSNYLRSLFALGFQAFLIMVCVAIYAVLVQGISAGGDIGTALWTCIGYTVLLMMLLMLPFFLLAMFERHGQPLEVLIRHFIQARFVRPRIRVWQNDNFYKTIDRSIRNQQEVQKILRGKQRKNQADKG